MSYPLLTKPKTVTKNYLCRYISVFTKREISELTSCPIDRAEEVRYSWLEFIDSYRKPISSLQHGLELYLDTADHRQ